jgi:hypothetical protein
MQVVVHPFQPENLFSSIRWNAKRQDWNSSEYRELVQRDGQTSPSPAHSIQLESISPQSALFKASLERVRTERDGSEVKLVFEWSSRDGSVEIAIVYERATLLQCSGLGDLLAGAELLGHELVPTDQGWRHALLFIENEYALVECASVAGYSVRHVAEKA